MNTVKRWLSLVCATALLTAVLPAMPLVSAASTTLYYEDFEGSTVPSGFTLFDADGDGYGWELDTGNYNGYPSGGHSFYSTSAKSWSNYLTPDDWFTLPAVLLPSASQASCELSFQIRTSYMSGYSDYIQVYASTSPITDVTTLTEADCILDEQYYTGYEYEKMTVNLDAYRGRQVYLAFRHHKATGVWQMYLDDITVTAKEPTKHRVQLPAKNDVFEVLTASGTNEVIDGSDFVFMVTVNSAYKPENGTLTVKANGKELQLKNGLYTIPDVHEKQKVDIDFTYAAGDLNADLAVNMMDVLMLYTGLSGQLTLNSVQVAAGEIDVNEGVNMADALCMYSYCNGQRAYLDTNKDTSLIWNAAYADSANGFTDLSSVESAEYYLNARSIKDYSAAATAGDAKQIFYADGKARVVNLADGYAVTLPFDDFTPDYSLGALRSRYETEDMLLSITYEDKSTYGNTASGWNTYLTEWLNRYVANDSFLSYNDIERTRAAGESTSVLSGYTVLTYDMHLENDENLEYSYYQIAVIRKSDVYNRFYMVHLKSKTQQTTTIDAIVKSFKEITRQGTAQNVEKAYACEIPETWNDATKAYYQKLLEQDATDWGFFSASMVDSADSSYSSQDSRITSEYERLSTAMDYEYDIMPTYTHLKSGSFTPSFPTEMANKYAGGNGFNGKPVLQFTYQFTTANNVNLTGYTPMFDILRGEYDEQFRKLARDIKAYKQPVLFRLNNEMNTDWTSYCGIVTLLDPDVFTATWERLYAIFEEEGVDNCIWIFNPFAVSYPYSRWGDYLSYLPDLDTVHVLGLTAYEAGNGTSLESFESLYKKLYQKNTPYFDNYPWVISEFGAGAGGEKQYNYSTAKWEDTVGGRNAAKQAAWVEAMFDNLSHRNEAGYEYCKNIKGAVWFSANDYVSVDNSSYVSNYFALDTSLTATLEAFRKGLNE